MEELTTAKRVLRFGLYEVDFASQELRKSGIKIKIQDQPFQILALLLERPGQIVTREEIQKRLWSGDTFVDFDLGLNSAVKKLRQALGDESDNPRFIETLYRRGYRFLAPVQGEELLAPANGNGKEAHTSPSGEHTKAAEQATKGKSKVLAYLALALFLGIGLIVGYALGPPATPRITAYQQITRDGRPKYEMASDGERLYMQELDSGHFVIAQVSVAGGESSALRTPFTNTVMGGITPDGSALLVGELRTTNNQVPIWSLPLPTGAPRRLGDLLGESVSASPDGKWLVFSHGNAVYEANADGSQAHQLFSTSGTAFGLAISPDEKKFCFSVTDTNTGTSTVWVANRDGSNPHPVFPGAQASGHKDNAGAKWTADGKYLLFERYYQGHDNIWLLPQREHWFSREPKPVQLTNGPLDFRGPYPSRDARRFFAVGAQPRTELMRYDGASGFKPFLGGISATDLAFSSDGQWVAYVTVPDNSLWRSRVDGSERMQLTDPGKLWAGLPRWSPEGKQIVFMGRTPNTNWRAYLISANGGAFQDLVPSAPVGMDPGWTPDGKSIVLTLNDMGVTGRGISVLDLQSGKVSDLPGAEHFFSPRVSPDGRHIAAITTDSQTLMLYDVAAQKWAELVKTPIAFPSWSRNSQYLYFGKILSEDTAFYRVRISDHKLEKVVDPSNIRRFWGHMGEWTGLAPDDSLLLTSDASNQEVYAIDWSPN